MLTKRVRHKSWSARPPSMKFDNVAQAASLHQGGLLAYPAIGVVKYVLALRYALSPSFCLMLSPVTLVISTPSIDSDCLELFSTYIVSAWLSDLPVLCDN